MSGNGENSNGANCKMKNFKKITKINEDIPYNFYSQEALQYENEVIAYSKMAKAFLNKPFAHPNDIIGNLQWHEALPYENWLFYHLDGGKPLVDMASSTAVDFGCGPGRMVNRARRLFKKVDGIDASEYALDYAKQTYSGSDFYVSSGMDVGNAPEDTYDLVFSTISIQHIPVKTIRHNIFQGLHNSLKPGGWFSIQVGYAPDIKAGVWSHDSDHASYDSDFFNATATNGHADCVVNEQDIPKVHADLSSIFSNVQMALVNVSSLYPNLNGAYHSPYWCTDWLFLQGRKE